MRNIGSVGGSAAKAENDKSSAKINILIFKINCIIITCRLDKQTAKEKLI
jgi:hypothetical protein